MNRRLINTLFFSLSFVVSFSINGQSWYFLDVGIKAYQTNNIDDAINIFKRGIYEGNPNSDNSQIPDLYFWLGKAYLKKSLNNQQLVIKYLDTAINNKQNRTYTESYYLRGRLNLLQEGLTNDVKQDLKIAISSANKNDIIVKALSFFYSGDSINLIEFLDKNLTIGKKKSNFNILSQVHYVNAAIHSDKNQINLALNELDLSLSQGLDKFDYLYFDFHKISHKEAFLSFLEQHNIIQYYSPYISNKDKILKYVETKINKWQKRGKYEKSEDYLARVTEVNRKKKTDYYAQEAIDSIGSIKINWELLIADYDPDNESYRLLLEGFKPMYISVPIEEAPEFDENFHNLNFKNVTFVLLPDYEVELQHFEIINPINNKIYSYNSQESVTYVTSTMNFNFDNLDINITKPIRRPQQKDDKSKTVIVDIGKSDVDVNIPLNSHINEKALALIIGNEDYSRFQTGLASESNVDFANRDAEIFAQYAQKTLGIPNENITLLLDATSVQMQREIEKLAELTLAYKGEANILFYYAGHGFPDEETKESYLMPVDVSGADVRHGIKLNYLYEKLTKYPSRKVIVLLDACFSGGGRNQGLLAARGVQIKPKENVISGNLAVLTSSSGEQSSLPYANKQHGMFTYFLLKKLKDSIGEITLEQLSDYLSREVQINSLKINSKKQSPSILVSPDVENIWMDWKIY